MQNVIFNPLCNQEILALNFRSVGDEDERLKGLIPRLILIAVSQQLF